MKHPFYYCFLFLNFLRDASSVSVAEIFVIDSENEEKIFFLKNKKILSL